LDEFFEVPTSLLFVVTEDWYFLSHRLPVARAARDSGYVVSVACNVTSHADAIRAEGFTLYPISVKRRSINPLHELKAMWQLARVFRRSMPDIVHAVALKPILQAGFVGWILQAPRIVYAVTGLGFIFSSRSRRARTLKFMVGKAMRFLFSRRNAWVIFQNRDDSDALRSEGLVKSTLATLEDDARFARDQRSVLIPGSGVDTASFPASAVPETLPDRPIELTLVSRMLTDKGIGEFATAGEILRARGVSARFSLVGEPDADNPATIPRETLRSWHDSGSVTWHGRRNDIADVWLESSVAVLPSYREGLPMSLLEAASCGRPMVATDVPGCREICRDGETGLLVPPRDPEALADALETLVRDPSLREKLGRNARALVEREFSAEIVAEKTLKLYQIMLERRL